MRANLRHRAIPVYAFVCILLMSSTARGYEVLAEYRKDTLVLSLGALEVQIVPTHVVRILRDQLSVINDIQLTVESGAGVARQQSAHYAERSLSALRGGVEVVLQGAVVTEPCPTAGAWTYDQTIRLMDNGHMTIAYEVAELLQPGSEQSYPFIYHNVSPYEYRDLEVTDEFSNRVVHAGAYRSLQFPHGATSWSVQCTTPPAPGGSPSTYAPYIYSTPPLWFHMFRVRCQEISVPPLTAPHRYLIMEELDFSALLDSEPWSPTASRRIVTLTQSILCGQFQESRQWYDRSEEEIGQAVSLVAEQADVAEFYGYPGLDDVQDFAGKLRTYLDSAHAHDLRIALNFRRDRYPESSTKALLQRAATNPPDSFFACVLAPPSSTDGVFKIAFARPPDSLDLLGGQSWSDAIIPTIDIADRAAVKHMASSLQSALLQAGDIDYFMFDESSLALRSLEDGAKKACSCSDSHPLYYSSPTYSDSALAWWQEYMRAKYPDSRDAKFPVLQEDGRIDGLEDKLTYAPLDAPIWNDWEGWREEVLAHWLDAMAEAVSTVASATQDREHPYQEAVYFCSSWYPFPQVGGFHGRKSGGVDLEKIMAYDFITWIVMSENTSYGDFSRGSWEIDSARQLVRQWNLDHPRSQKKFGLHVLTDNYTGVRFNLGEAPVIAQLQAVLDAKPDMIVVHGDGPMIPRADCDPIAMEEGVGPFDLRICRLWNEWRFRYMWDTPKAKLVSVVGPLKLVWRSVPDAVGYRIMYSSGRGTSRTIDVAAGETAYAFPWLRRILSWQVQAKFSISGKGSVPLSEPLEFLGEPAWRGRRIPIIR